MSTGGTICRGLGAIAAVLAAARRLPIVRAIDWTCRTAVRERRAFFSSENGSVALGLFGRPIAARNARWSKFSAAVNLRAVQPSEEPFAQ